MIKTIYSPIIIVLPHRVATTRSEKKLLFNKKNINKYDFYKNGANLTS
jgi:hypothetical protein